MSKRKRPPKHLLDDEELIFGANWNQTDGWKGANELRSHVRVQVVGEDNAVIEEFPTWGLLVDIEAMKRQYPHVSSSVKGVWTTEIKIPPEHLKLVDVDMNAGPKKSPLMCTYDATKNYLESILGIKLSEEDREFFSQHPLVQTDGVPFPDTLRVVQELVEPYGVFISRVQIAQGYSVRGDIRQWRRVLGINPMALGDRMTSNAEFEERTGGKVSTEDFRFEFTNEPLFPSVSCGVIGATQGVTGSTGGHAVFVPPRRRANGSLLAFQLSRGAETVWHIPPIFEEIPAPTPKVVTAFDLDSWYKSGFRESTFAPKTTVVAHVSGKRTKEGKEEVVEEGQTWIEKAQDRALGILGGMVQSALGLVLDQINQKYPSDGHGITVLDDAGNRVCFMCKRAAVHRKHTWKIPGICDQCWNSLGEKVTCGKANCRHDVFYPIFDFVRVEAGTAGQHDRLFINCRSCRNTVWVTEEMGGPLVARAFEAIAMYRDCQEILRKDRDAAIEIAKQRDKETTPTPSGAAPEGGADAPAIH